MSSKDKVTKALEIIGKSMDELDRAYGILHDLKKDLVEPLEDKLRECAYHVCSSRAMHGKSFCVGCVEKMRAGWNLTDAKLNDECGAQ